MAVVALDVAMLATQRKAGVIVVKPGRLLEAAFVVALLAGVSEPTLVVVVVTGDTFLLKAEVGPSASRFGKALDLGRDLKPGFVTIAAAGLRVLAGQGVAHGLVVEGLGTAAGPADDVEFASAVILVTLAASARCPRRVIAATGLDAVVQRVVASEATRWFHASAARVTLLALLGAFQLRVSAG